MFALPNTSVATLIKNYWEVKFSVVYCSAELIFMHLTPRKKVVWINLVTTSKQFKKPYLCILIPPCPHF